MPKNKSSTRFQIVPKNNVVKFPAQSAESRKWIPLPPGSSGEDTFDELTIINDSLKFFGIITGDLLTVKTNFRLSDIKPLSLCVVVIGNETDIYPVEITADGKIKIFCLKAAENRFFAQEFDLRTVEILGIAVEVRRPLV